MFVALVAFSSCEKYDDSSIKESIENLTDRVESLEEACDNLNSSISSIQTIVNALENNISVVTVNSVKENGVEVGYEIVFSDGSTITIKNGADGADGEDGKDGNDGSDFSGSTGSSTVIGVVEDNGVDYWTINGVFLTDADGNKLPVTGATPVMGIQEEDGVNYWTVNGEFVTNANGEKVAVTGDSVFASEDGVVVGEDSVTFTLADGTTFVLPLLEEYLNGISDIIIDSYSNLVKGEDGIYYLPTGYCDGDRTTDEGNDGIIDGLGATVEVNLPLDAVAFEVTVINSDGTSTDITTRAAAVKEWDVTDAKMASALSDKIPASFKLRAYNDASLARLTVTCYDKDMNSESRDFLVKVYSEAVFNSPIEPGQLDKELGYGGYENYTAITFPEGSKLNLDDINVLKQMTGLSGAIDLSTVSFGNGAMNSSAFGTELTSMPNIFGEDRTATVVENTVETPDVSFSANTNITSVILPAGIISYDDYAFMGCVALESVTIAGEGSATDGFVGESAFEGCTSLTTVDVLEGVVTIKESAFEDCTSLKAIELPEGLTTIEDNAFDCCTALTTLVLPSTVTTLGDNVFNGCSNLKELALPDKLTSIGSNSMPNSLESVVIPSTVTSLDAHAFVNCASISSVTAPAVCSTGTSITVGGTAINTLFKSSLAKIKTFVVTGSGLTAIPDNGFDGFIALSTFEIPSTVKTIGASAFEGTALAGELVIPSKVTSIGATAFKGLTKITSVTLPASLTTVDATAFSGCTGITKVTTSLLRFGTGSTSPVLSDIFAASASKITEVVLTENSSLTTISGSSFSGFTNLKELTIPSTIVTIGGSAFKNTGLTSVTISEGVETVAANAFANCPLTEVTLPSTLTSIDVTSFDGVSTITTVNTSDLTYGGLSLGEIFADSKTSISTVNVTGDITSIAGAAFDGFTALTAFEIPATVTSIGNSAFKNTALTAIEIPALVATIGNYAFVNTAISALEIPASVTSIGNSAFANTVLTSIEIPATVTSVGTSAFGGISTLTSVVDYSAAAYSSTASDSPFYGSANIEEVTIYASKNGNFATAYASSIDSITTVNLLEDVADSDGNVVSVSISANAFRELTSLKSITLPANVAAVGANAFYSCSSLENVELSSATKSIGTLSFALCSNLKTFTIPHSDSIPYADNAFYLGYGVKAEARTLYVPTDRVDAFMKSNWYSADGSDGKFSTVEAIQ